MLVGLWVEKTYQCGMQGRQEDMEGSLCCVLCFGCEALLDVHCYMQVALLYEKEVHMMEIRCVSVASYLFVQNK